MCSLWLRTGCFQMLFWSVIQARTAHSAAPQIANLLTLPIQQNKYSCSLAWSLRIKGSRTSLFCSLLSQELGLCYAKIYWLYSAGSTKYYLSTRNRLSLIVNMLPVQIRKRSFQHPWHDENIFLFLYHPILVSTLPPRVYQEQWLCFSSTHVWILSGGGLFYLEVIVNGCL